MAQLPDGWIITTNTKFEEGRINVELVTHELVYCEHCKHMEHAINGNGGHGYCCNKPDSPVKNECWLKADWFCADGERKGENE